MMSNLSRRDFVAMAGAALASTKFAHGQKGTLTAGEVADRIRKNINAWNDKTYRDGFKIGSPDMPVHGIATSFGGNFRVLDLADKAGLNMVIVHEPTFYSDADVIDWVKDDPLYKAKLDWAKKHNIVVWRTHDSAHAHKPDFIATGFNKALGWELVESTPRRLWKVPPTTLDQLAKNVAKTLNTQSVRVVGDPNLRVTTVAGGGHGLTQNIAATQAADCFLLSEAREYDSFEYIRDTVYTGAKKGGIFISHQSGEDEGMREFASWLTPLVPELPVKFIPTTDEYWTV
jgi:putative NIF3 family GTP cyclohydrolase 1 type 2